MSAAVDGLRVARAVLGGQCSDVGAASGVEDPQDVAAVAALSDAGRFRCLARRVPQEHACFA